MRSGATLAVQHASLAYNLAGSDGRADDHLSDHLGINVDLNLHQAGCHPMHAHALDPVGDHATVDGRIRHPGGLQSHRLAARGAFEISLVCQGAAGDSALEVYAAEDISRPLSWVATNGTQGGSARRYALAGETFIRVGITKSGLSGEYVLGISPAR